MRAKIIILCAIVSVVAIALILDLDYDRYADRLADSADAVIIEIDNSPNIPVFLGCEDLMDKRAFMSEQYNTIYADKTVGEMLWFFEEIDELNKQYTENNCTGSFINGEIVR